MKKSIFSRFVSMTVVAAISMFFIVECAEDPANNNSGGVGGGDDNGGGNNNGSGGEINYTISELTIKNNTGYQICYISIKPSTSTNWDSKISCLSDGKSEKLTFSKPLSATNGVDIGLSANAINSSSGNKFIKYKVTVSNGMTVTFTSSDFTDGNNLPNITIQNRTGISFDAIYIRPSSMPDESSDWGKDYGSLSNNGDKSISIPIPPSSYTTFDIQIKSSNPTNTYTKKNITISDGMILTYNSEDSDNPFTGSPFIVIHNNTGYQTCYISIKPSTSTNWDSKISCLSDGKAEKLTLSQSLSANSVYDIGLSVNAINSSNGNKFIKYSVSVSNGMDVFFTASDLTDGSDIQSITIQNRTGVNFNAIYVKPSDASDWGKDYGSLSNNSDKSISIPIPPSNYTTFDIQMRSSNPTNTYTKNVTVSNGMVLTYTSEDSDNPFTGSPFIVIHNNTGYQTCYISIKPTTSTDWDSKISCLSDGKSEKLTLSQSLSANSEYDIGLSTNAINSSSGNKFIKYNVSVSNGMDVFFTDSDLQQ